MYVSDGGGKADDDGIAGSTAVRVVDGPGCVVDATSIYSFENVIKNI
jgi:hypothetical protein